MNNPFELREEKENIVGRKEQEETFQNLIKTISGGRIIGLSISGPRGYGKTTMLLNFESIAEKEGFKTIFVKIEKRDTDITIINKLSKGTSSNIEEFIDESNKNQFGTLILLDDLDKSSEFEKIVLDIEKLINNNKGKIGFVISSTLGIRSPFLRSQLNPFDVHAAEELVEKALKDAQIKMGEECLKTILNESGGNPKIFKIICWHLYNNRREKERIISKGNYLVLENTIRKNLEHDWFGELYSQLPNEERKILKSLAKKEMNTFEIAKDIGKNSGPTNTLILRLLNRGQIIRIKRGVYRIIAPLYGKYISEQ